MYPFNLSLLRRLAESRCRSLAILIALVCNWAGAVAAEPVNLSVVNSKGTSGSVVEVPIQCTAPAGLSCARFLVSYDPQVLEFHEAQQGAGLPENALVVSKCEQPGAVGVVFWCGVKEDRSGLDGLAADGEVVKLRFLARDRREID